jgi:hypothetical protein
MWGGNGGRLGGTYDDRDIPIACAMMCRAPSGWTACAIVNHCATFPDTGRDLYTSLAESFDADFFPFYETTCPGKDYESYQVDGLGLGR